MEIIDIIKIIRDGTPRESDNAQGELLRRTIHWINRNPKLTSSIFTQICHRYHVNKDRDSLNEMDSIYNDSIVRIINNIKKGNLDKIESQGAFEAYSKMICANICKEWIKIQYKGGMKSVPVYINSNKAYLIHQDRDYIRDNAGDLKIFENLNQAKKYLNDNGEGNLIALTSINDEGVLDEVNHLVSKVSYTEMPVDDILEDQTSDELSYYEERLLQDFIGIYQKKIPVCRNIFKLSAIYDRPKDQFIAWREIEGNENKQNSAFRKKKADCKSKLLHLMKKSEQVIGSKTFMDFIDHLYGDDTSLFVQ